MWMKESGKMGENLSPKKIGLLDLQLYYANSHYSFCFTKTLISKMAK
jgi:hypothetical protein